MKKSAFLITPLAMALTLSACSSGFGPSTPTKSPEQPVAPAVKPAPVPSTTTTPSTSTTTTPSTPSTSTATTPTPALSTITTPSTTTVPTPTPNINKPTTTTTNNITVPATTTAPIAGALATDNSKIRLNPINGQIYIKDISTPKSDKVLPTYIIDLGEFSADTAVKSFKNALSDKDDRAGVIIQKHSAASISATKGNPYAVETHYNTLATIPTQGTATYQGSALLVNMKNKADGIVKHNFNYTADFAAKTGQGEITGTFGTISLPSQAFDTSTLKDGGYEVTFHGDNAEEIAGKVYKDNKYGAFVGTKK